MRSSHVRIDWTANSAVSEVIPTLTQPSRPPRRRCLAEGLVREVVHLHAMRIALGTIIFSAVPVVAELQRQHLDYGNIVAIDIGESGTITVYTFGAWT
jgi:hypothetical protein